MTKNCLFSLINVLSMSLQAQNTLFDKSKKKREQAAPLSIQAIFAT